MCKDNNQERVIQYMPARVHSQMDGDSNIIFNRGYNIMSHLFLMAGYNRLTIDVVV